MIRKLATAAIFTAFLSQPVSAQETAILSAQDIQHPVFAAHGMVASQEARATGIGVDLLKAGGNAVDAAVGIGFALAVTLPRAGNLGGGGFMLVHDAEKMETVAIDYRERAPKAATRDMYLDKDGNVIKNKSRFTPFAVGVPGTVHGMIMAHKKYGRLPLTVVIEPAIKLASEGIIVTPDLANSLERSKKRLAKNPASAAIFYKADGGLYQVGERLFQVDLANSLRLIANEGAAGFYEGKTATAIAREMKRTGGLITRDDLEQYRAIVRQPVRGNYRGYEIASMPPPSSGGVHLIQILNILEEFPIGKLGHNGSQTIHLMVEAMKLAYADRATHLGDPDYWKVPMKGLIDKKYAASLRQTIDRKKARPAKDIKASDPLPYESNETTHFSVMDMDGNVVSNTYTLNFSYGSGITVPGTGILLNNEMDDFSAKSGVPNAYGLIGGDANAVEGGKRPLSSMTPTIVFKDGEAFLATGSPGGSRIITTVLQVIMNVIDHQMNIMAASAAPRIHHQWLPDYVRMEPGLSPDTTRILGQMGHTLKQKWAMGSTQSIMRIKDGFLGASDPRRRGALTSGY
jgi:gamma-glutamyltranspeptidase/glutathione hydrolase